jgi:HlyD family secretion protein
MNKFLTVLALTVALSGCNLHGRPKVERKARAVAAPALAAAAAVEPDTIVSPGIVEPWGAQVELSAQESGWIAEILVKEGAIVQSGQSLATLEESAQRHNVDLARADLAEAEATLTRIEHGPTVEELRQAQGDDRAAAVRGEFARASAVRMTRLHDDGVVSADTVDRAVSEARAQSALADRTAARLRELERGSRAEDRQAARARVMSARARLRVTEDALARRRIVAPGAGVVLLSRFHAGEFYDVGAGPLLILGDMSRLQVRLEVDEIDALALHRGDACALYSDGGGRLAGGTVVRLAPKMGRRALPLESPTARQDVRVREVFVEVPATSTLIPGQRVWGHTRRNT